MDRQPTMINTIIIVGFIVILIIIIIIIIITDSNNYVIDKNGILESDFSLTPNLYEMKNIATKCFDNVPIYKRLHEGNQLAMYNLSVHKFEDGYKGVIRGSSSDGCRLLPSGPLYSYVYYVHFNHSGAVVEVKLLDLDYQNMNGCTGKLGYETNGVEDPKLFIYKKQQWAVANVTGSKLQTNICKNAICIFNVQEPLRTFKILSVPSNVKSDQIQKNWSLFEHEGDLLCEYSINPHIILKVDPNIGITNELYRTNFRIKGENTDVTKYGSLRGGGCSIITTLMNKKYYINIGHTQLDHDYKHFFYIFEDKPPFNILAISKQMKLDHDVKIQFAAGISEYDNNIYISYGMSDCHNRISIFSKSKIMSLFPEIFNI